MQTRIKEIKTKKMNATNIADWMEYWDTFDKDLYIQYLIAKQNTDFKPVEK